MFSASPNSINGIATTANPIGYHTHIGISPIVDVNVSFSGICLTWIIVHQLYVTDSGTYNGNVLSTLRF